MVLMNFMNIIIFKFKIIKLTTKEIINNFNYISNFMDFMVFMALINSQVIIDTHIVNK